MILLLYTTHATLADAQNCANQLLHARLVACVNIFPIESAYWWQNNIAQEGEIVALFKTRPDLQSQVEAAIQAIHPYEVPCIISWQVKANEKYEAWIYEQTSI